MPQHGSKYFARRPPPLTTLVIGQLVKIQFFQDMAMLHKKLNGITKCSNMVPNILPTTPPPPTMPLTPSIGQHSTFSEHGHVSYQIKGQHGNRYFSHKPLDPGGWFNRSKFNFFRTWSCCITDKGNRA